MEAVIRGAASIGLLSHGVYQYQNDPNWWLCVPAYSLSALVCFLPFPNRKTWRILSGISVLGGGLLMLFLWWTFRSLENTPGFEPSEARNLLPLAVGVALSTTTRLSVDIVKTPIQYIRAAILAALLAASTTLIFTAGKYYRYK